GEMINWTSWLFWGFIATTVLTTLLSSSQGLGLTRMNIPYLLGTMFTPNRDRAKLIGIFYHFFNGWLFSLIYLFGFEVMQLATWWFGALLGLLHGLFVLTVGIPLLPTMHPRMANEQQGPTVVKQLEPPGFLALNYGFQTPLSVIVAHIVFGV